MSLRALGAAWRRIDQLFGSGTVAGLSEGQLLERFIARRDEAAFEALLARHGPMVLNVCHRLLDDPHDVEDAFQATFLILVRKAGAIRQRELLAPWLYGVAHRIARRAQTLARRRRAREGLGAEEAAVAPENDTDRRERERILHEEIDRLPEKYRAPVVLCYLEGLTHDQAADALCWPVGTVRGRLARARDCLRERLTRRGLALPAGLLGALLSEQAASAAVAPALEQATLKAALALAMGGSTAGVVSASVATLMKEGLRAMFLNKLTLAAVTLVVALGVAAGAGAWAWQASGEGQKDQNAAAEAPKAAGDFGKASVPQTGERAGEEQEALADQLEAARGELELMELELEAEKHILQIEIQGLKVQSFRFPRSGAPRKSRSGLAKPPIGRITRVIERSTWFTGHSWGGNSGKSPSSNGGCKSPLGSGKSTPQAPWAWRAGSRPSSGSSTGS
jgi:RNA polymerase sigma factor (sigma-70 family)